MPMARSRDWGRLPLDILVSIFSLLSTLDRLNSAAAVCRSWRIAASDASFTKVMDMVKCRAGLRLGTSTESAKHKVVVAFARGVNLGGSNLTTLVLDLLFKFSKRHFQHISLRCPNLQNLTLPFPNAVTKACLNKAFQLWQNLQSLHITSGGSDQLPVDILRIIGINSQRLRVLRISCEIFRDKQIVTIAKFMPSLKVLSVRCAMLDSKLVEPFSDNPSLEEVNLSTVHFRVYPWLDLGKIQAIINDKRRQKGFSDYRTFHMCRWPLGPCNCVASKL